jgi:hypothetical protein
MLGLMMLIVAIGVTAGTATQASTKPALYVLYLGKALLPYIMWFIGPTYN